MTDHDLVEILAYHEFEREENAKRKLLINGYVAQSEGEAKDMLTEWMKQQGMPT